MNRWMVWAICCINVGLVGYLGWRIVGREAVEGGNANLDSHVEASSVDTEKMSSEIYRKLVDRTVGGSDDWMVHIASHPEVSRDQWSETTRRTFREMRSQTKVNPSALERIQANQIFYARFGSVGPALEMLVFDWVDVVSDVDRSSAERQSALILIFRSVLYRPEFFDLQPKLRSEVVEVVQFAAATPGLVPVVIEGWGALYGNGQSDLANEMFSPQEVERMGIDNGAIESVIIQYVQILELVRPEVEWNDFSEWFLRGSPVVCREIARPLLKSGNPETVVWLESFSFDDPESEMVRLQLIESLVRKMEDRS